MLAMLVLAPALMTAIVQVDIMNFAFVPDSIRVQPGDSVRWTNKDGFAHTSSGTGTGVGLWTSGNLAPNQSYQRPFITAGSYDYHCEIHTSMTAKVVVGGGTGILDAEPATPGALDANAAPRDTRGRAADEKNPDPATPTFVKPPHQHQH